MTISIYNIPPIIDEISKNVGNKKKEMSLKISQTGSDEVNISGGADFISNLKNSIDRAQSVPTEKLNAVRQSVMFGSYADGSKIAGGLLKNLNITNE
ncbi:hypothetical protein ACMCNP_00695 [Candidatus Acidulodesulfobacterium sp. H_13]|uniref:hypothetical protein n=1 Tax=Candidatus Acidulodesulfobacterium sp. H_13 TaxID=3395470 RepID=UPI003AF4E213